MTSTHAAVDRLLGHLQLGREAPRLEYLHRLIREHQLRVPFETLTNLLDYEPGLRRGVRGGGNLPCRHQNPSRNGGDSRGLGGTGGGRASEPCAS